MKKKYMTEINEESKKPRNLRESKKEDQKSRKKSCTNPPTWRTR